MSAYLVFRPTTGTFSFDDALKAIFSQFELKPEYLPLPKTMEEVKKLFKNPFIVSNPAYYEKLLDQVHQGDLALNYFLIHHLYLQFKYFDFRFFDDVSFLNLESELDPESRMHEILAHHPTIEIFSPDSEKKRQFQVYPDPNVGGLVLYSTENRSENQIIDREVLDQAEKKYESLVAEGRVAAGFKLQLSSSHWDDDYYYEDCDDSAVYDAYYGDDGDTAYPC
jgi:hypothetical protein